MRYSHSSPEVRAKVRTIKHPTIEQVLDALDRIGSETPLMRRGKYETPENFERRKAQRRKNA